MIRLLVLLSLVLVASSCTPVASTEAISPRHDPAKVLGRTWLWQATVTPVERISVAYPERYTIAFAENGQLQARFDCNTGGGTYTLSAGQVSFGPLRLTRKACPEDSQDMVFMRDLQRAKTFFLQDDKLFLELPLDSGTMRFIEDNSSEPMKPTKCPELRPEMCTTEYDPVCGTLSDGSLKTYPNGCNACSDLFVDRYSQGECK